MEGQGNPLPVDLARRVIEQDKAERERACLQAIKHALDSTRCEMYAQATVVKDRVTTEIKIAAME